MGVIAAGRRNRCGGMGDAVREVVPAHPSRQVVLVVAVAPIGRGHLRLDPGFGPGQGGEFDHPEALPVVFGSEQSKPLQMHQPVLTRHRQHQVDMFL